MVSEIDDVTGLRSVVNQFSERVPWKRGQLEDLFVHSRRD